MSVQIGSGAKLSGMRVGSLNVDFGNDVVVNNVVLDTRSGLKTTKEGGLVVAATGVQLLTPEQLVEGNYHVREDSGGKFHITK